MKEVEFFEETVDAVLNALNNGFVIENKSGDDLYVRHHSKVNGIKISTNDQLNSFVSGYVHAGSSNE